MTELNMTLASIGILCLLSALITVLITTLAASLTLHPIRTLIILSCLLTIVTLVYLIGYNPLDLIIDKRLSV